VCTMCLSICVPCSRMKSYSTQKRPRSQRVVVPTAMPAVRRANRTCDPNLHPHPLNHHVCDYRCTTCIDRDDDSDNANMRSQSSVDPVVPTIRKANEGKHECVEHSSGVHATGEKEGRGEGTSYDERNSQNEDDQKNPDSLCGHRTQTPTLRVYQDAKIRSKQKKGTETFESEPRRLPSRVRQTTCAARSIAQTHIVEPTV
jgi:hypothetical protein